MKSFQSDVVDLFKVLSMKHSKNLPMRKYLTSLYVHILADITNQFENYTESQIAELRELFSKC